MKLECQIFSILHAAETKYRFSSETWKLKNIFKNKNKFIFRTNVFLQY